MRPGFRAFLLNVRTAAVAGLAGFAFAETASVGWLGLGWGALAAAVVVQAFRLRSLAVAVWTLAVVSMASAVAFSVPVASSAGRAAAIAALTSAPPSSNFVVWLGAICLLSAAIAVHDGIIVKVATLGAGGLDRLGLIGEGQRFGLLSGALALLGITLVETWPGGAETRLVAAAIPMVACGAIAMLEKILSSAWGSLNRAATGREKGSDGERPLAAPRVTREMTDKVAKNAGLLGKDVVVEQFVPDDEPLGKGEESYSPPLDYSKMAAMVAPRRRVELVGQAEPQASTAAANGVIAAARGSLPPGVPVGVKAEPAQSAQAAEEVGPLDLWDDDEVAEWETGVSSGQLEAMKHLMTPEEIDDYIKGMLANEKARRDREEHMQIAGVPEAAVEVAAQPAESEEDPRVFALIDLFAHANGPLAEATYRIVERFKEAPGCFDRIVELEPRARAFVDAIIEGRSEHELEIILQTPAGDIPDEPATAELSRPEAAVTAPEAIEAAAAMPEPVFIGDAPEEAAKPPQEMPKETVVQDDVIEAAASAAATSYTQMVHEPGKDAQIAIPAKAEPVASPYSGLAEKFATLNTAFHTVLHAQRKTEGEGAADLEGLLVADPAVVRQYGADTTLVKALLAFSGNDMSFYVVRSAIEMLVRRTPTQDSDPLCGVLMQVLRDAPLEAFGAGPEAADMRRSAETRLGIVLLESQIGEMVEFCQIFADGKLEDRDACNAASAAQPLFAAVAGANPGYATLPGGGVAIAAFEDALSHAREVVAMREEQPTTDVIERDRANVLTDENQKRGMAAALRRLMPAPARLAIDELRDIGRAARLLSVYLWRRGGLPVVEAHPLYPSLTLMTAEMVRASDAAVEAAGKDVRNLDAILAGADKDLPKFLQEHISEGGREALSQRVARAMGADRAIADVEPVLAELRQQVVDRENECEQARAELEFEKARGPVDRACDVIVHMLESHSTTVHRVEPGDSAPAQLFYNAKDGDVAFVVIDGLGARWRLNGSSLLCAQFALSFDFELACAAMPRTTGISRAGSFRLVLCNCAGLETAEEPGIVRIEDIEGADDASRVRAARFLEQHSDLMVWK